jgi:glucose-6-phosphate isomerase
MLFEHGIDGCFADRVGEAGLDRAPFESFLARADDALKALREAHEKKSLPLLTVPEARADLSAATQVAERLRANTTDILLFGTGGSCLGAQALAQLVGFGTPAFEWPSGAPRLHFFDNLDAESLSAALARLRLKTTRFLVVSKSGGTPETMSQMLAAIEALETAGGGGYLAQHFAVICEPGKSPLRRLAERHGMPVLDHPPGVGGRFSVLTVVGLLPALLMGLDPIKLREGAASVLTQALGGAKARDVPAAQGAAVAVALAERRQIAACVLMPYLDRLERFALWYRQLWAESLGKNGKGLTPIRALGPVDQHSQLQLYLDGPKDKLFTLIMGPAAGTGPRITARATGGDPDLAYLEGRMVGDLVDAEQRATAETLIRNGRSTRVIRIARLDEEVMGALFMHFMLETIIAAHLMKIDAFDQPAVEQGKILTRQYLKEGVS